MARLSKHELLQVFEGAVRESGWSFLHLSPHREHPARYHVYCAEATHRLGVHIWNVTHGGGAARPSGEYRIQITGLEEPSGSQQFQPEVGGKTLILGWWDEVGVFAGFDYAKHSGPLGSSPSMQIGEEALRKASMSGFAPHNRGQGEIAIAFRPDFLGTYVANLERLHACGEFPRELAILGEIADENVEDQEIARAVAQERQYAVISTKRALRDISFRQRVLTVYGYACAMCGLQLKLVDAAHVLPVLDPESTDETSNGIALCSLHHRAYDNGFATFGADYRIYLNEAMVGELKARGLDGKLDRFHNNLRPFIALPPDKRDYPAPAFIEKANALRGWEK